MSEDPPAVASRPPASGTSTPGARPPRHRTRRPPRPGQGGDVASTPDNSIREHRLDGNANNAGASRSRNHGRAPRTQAGNPQSQSAPAQSTGTNAPRPRRKNNTNATNAAVEPSTTQSGQTSTNDASSSGPPSQPPRSQRRKQFGAQLTSASNDDTARSTSSRGHHHRPAPQRAPAPSVDLDELDLTSRLIHSFTHNDDAIDCPICFNTIRAAQPIWSCSPSSESPDSGSCCWGTFHLKCISSWAAKSEFIFAYRVSIVSLT